MQVSLNVTHGSIVACTILFCDLIFVVIIFFVSHIVIFYKTFIYYLLFTYLPTSVLTAVFQMNTCQLVPLNPLDFPYPLFPEETLWE